MRSPVDAAAGWIEFRQDINSMVQWMERPGMTGSQHHVWRINDSNFICHFSSVTRTHHKLAASAQRDWI